MIGSCGINPIEAVFFMISKEKKKEIIKELSDKLKKQKAVIFFDFTGLPVSQFQEFRRQLREKEIDCQVAKKSLIDLALNKSGLENIKVKEMTGQVALVFSYEDEVYSAKILNKLSEENESVEILAGLINNQYLDSEAIITLAKLPAREELLAKLIGSLKAPIAGLSNVLQGNLRKLTFILKSCSM